MQGAAHGARAMAASLNSRSSSSLSGGSSPGSRRRRDQDVDEELVQRMDLMTNQEDAAVLNSSMPRAGPEHPPPT